MSNSVVLPDGRPLPTPTIVFEDGVPRVAGTITRAEFEYLERVRNSQFFLVPNGGPGSEYGEKPRCRNCNQQHAYITYMCIERPFRGLEQGLQMMIRVTDGSTDGSRFGRALSKLDAFQSRHPETARQLAPSEPGENWYALLLGGPEPIDAERAFRLAQRINDRRPPIPFIL